MKEAGYELSQNQLPILLGVGTLALGGVIIAVMKDKKK